MRHHAFRIGLILSLLLAVQTVLASARPAVACPAGVPCAMTFTMHCTDPGTPMHCCPGGCTSAPAPAQLPATTFRFRCSIPVGGERPPSDVPHLPARLSAPPLRPPNPLSA